MWSAAGDMPASQIVSEARTNDAFVYAPATVNQSYAVNGLNQYTTAGGASLAYDPDGNLSNDGSSTYGYDAENRLISATGAKTATLLYDPLGRLWSTTGSQAGSTTLFLHDGDQIAVELNGSGALLRRYMWGPGIDEPIVWDEGGALACGSPAAPTTRVLHADHEGSVVAYADCWGNQIGIDAYDEHGVPAAANAGRFGYTGQAWIPELGMYYYKARIYAPSLGRFMQTDPVGYKDQVNLYEYVGDDPVNGRDPSGLETCQPDCTGSRLQGPNGNPVSHSFGAGHDAGIHQQVGNALHGAAAATGKADDAGTAFEGAAHAANIPGTRLPGILGFLASVTGAADDIAHGVPPDEAIVSHTLSAGLGYTTAIMGGALGVVGGATVPIGGETGVTEVAGGALGATVGGRVGTRSGEYLGEGYSYLKRAVISASHDEVILFGRAYSNVINAARISQTQGGQ